MANRELPQAYLAGLAENQQRKVENGAKPEEKILMYSGKTLDWVGEYVNDKSISWTLRTMPLDELTLTRGGPDWNEIIVGKAERSPAKLRILLQDPATAKVFANSVFTDIPILVRKEEDTLKVLDGMNRTIAAIRDGRDDIRAYIGERTGTPQPIVEAHVVYDFIRAYEQRGGDKDDFKSGLRFLANSYTNVRPLLSTRFGPAWTNHNDINQVISEIILS